MPRYKFVILQARHSPRAVRPKRALCPPHEKRSKAGGVLMGQQEKFVLFTNPTPTHVVRRYDTQNMTRVNLRSLCTLTQPRRYDLNTYSYGNLHNTYTQPSNSQYH